MSDVFEKWLQEYAPESGRVDFGFLDLSEAFESGRNSMLAELLAKVPSDSECQQWLAIESGVSTSIDNIDAATRFVFGHKAMSWLKTKIFGGVDELQ
jgi:hypothetical protein